MNKRPIAIFSTDWHIKDDNIEQIIDLVTQQCELAKELKVTTLICLGDVFNSRKSQTLQCLGAFERILNIVYDYNLMLLSIPGNHDKTNIVFNFGIRLSRTPTNVFKNIAVCPSV